MIALAEWKDQTEILALDRHLPPDRLRECIGNGQVYVLRDGNIDCGRIVGVLRYSFFWQTIPFLDLLYLEESYRRRGYGTGMMQTWEKDMANRGYRYVMTSTQADESAWRFYEKLGYRKTGGFFPPEQTAEELIYGKALL